MSLHKVFLSLHSYHRIPWKSVSNHQPSSPLSRGPQYSSDLYWSGKDKQNDNPIVSKGETEDGYPILA